MSMAVAMLAGYGGSTEPEISDETATEEEGAFGDVIIISFDATHDGFQYTLDGKINCNAECNPI